MPRKQLFLDVDGVLHPFYGEHIAESNVTTFHTDCMQRLQRIVEATDCEIVLSSSWRNFINTRNILHANLAQYGLTFTTWIEPDMPGSHTSPSAGKFSKILSFVQVHHPTDWVVFDDEDLIALSRADQTSTMCKLFESRLIRTNSETGLTDIDVELAIRILNNLEEEED